MQIVDKTGQPTLALQELAVLEEKRDFVIVWNLAMIFAHNKCKYIGNHAVFMIDKEAIATLEAKNTIALNISQSSERAHCLAGLFSWHVKDLDGAATHFKNALVKNANSVPALVGLGWLEIENTRNDYFEQAMQISLRDLEAMLGQCVIFRKERKASMALEVCNRIIAYFPNFVPALVERLYILLEMLSWDALLEAAQRLGGVAQDNLDSLIMVTWFEICTEGPSDTVATYLKTLRNAIERLEPGNADILYEIARPFTRLANKNFKVLEECEKMVHESAQLSNHPKYQLELGYIYFLMGLNRRANLGELAKSKECYDRASSLDAHNVEAVEGSIRWLIYTDQLDEAQGQLEMFTELQRSVGLSAPIAHLNSILALKKHMNHELWLVNLKEALQVQLRTVQGKPITLQYYVHFNPEFILSIVRSYMDSNAWQFIEPGSIMILCR